MKTQTALTSVALLIFSTCNFLGCNYTALPVRPAAKALVVEIKGPQAILLGDTATYYLSIVGEHGLPRWDFIAPPEESANESSLKPVDSLASMAVEFSPVVPGDHIIIASVGGPGDQAVPAKKRITVVDPQAPEEPDPNQPSPGPPQPEGLSNDILQKLLGLVNQQKPTTIPTATDRLKPILGNIASETYDHDKKLIFSCLQSMISRISTGLIPPETDVIHELSIDVSNTLGTNYDVWKPFFSEMQNVVDILRQQGTITSASTVVPLLAEMKLLFR